MAKSDTDKNLVSFFAALCMFLSVIEYSVPKPVPFMRLGLANLPVILSLAKMRTKDTALLVLLKVLCQGFVSGTFFSYIFLFSAASSFASALSMVIVHAACRKRRAISYMGISLAGALSSNIAQLSLARCVLFGGNTRYIAPVLLFTGLATGVALGAFANLFAEKSKWYSSLPDVFQMESAQ